MRNAIVIATVLAVSLLGLVALRGDADAKSAAAQDIEKLEAKLAVLTEKYELLNAAFVRHSHPVLMWDPKSKRSAAWQNGTYFIAYPKIGRGDEDVDAMRAGGRWGTP